MASIEEAYSIIREDNIRQLRVFFEALSEDENTETLHNDEGLLKQCSVLACQEDAPQCLSYSLDRLHCISSNNGVVKDSSGKSLLHIAARNCSKKCLQILLDAGYEMESCFNGKTAYEEMLESLRHELLNCHPSGDILTTMKATQELDLECLEIFVKHMDDIAALAFSLALDGKFEDMALLLAASKGKLLFDSIRNVGCEEGGMLVELLTRELLSENKEIGTRSTLRDSMLKCLRIALLWKDKMKNSRYALSVAQEKGSEGSLLLLAGQAASEDVVNVLLECGVDPNYNDGNGNSALHMSMLTSRCPEVSRICWKLVRRGAQVLRGNRLEVSPVHLAAGQGHLGALKICLGHAPEGVNLVSVMKETPLFWAVRSRHLDCVKVLLHFGADVFALNIRRQRPLDIADTPEIRMILQEGVRYYPVEELNCFHLLPKDQEVLSGLMRKHTENLFANDYGYPRTAQWNELQPELNGNKLLHNPPPKTELCRYFIMAGGCVRGDQCLFAHGEGDLVPVALKGYQEVNSNFRAGLPTAVSKNDNDLTRRKIFVGGLSPSVESGDLWSYFEERFGPVVDAVVIGSQTPDHKFASRGFGFVTFRFDQSVTAAIKEHYVILFGKKVEIKSAVPRPTLQEAEKKEFLSGEKHRSESCPQLHSLRDSLGDVFVEGKEVSSGMKQLSLTDGNDEWKTHLNLQDNNGMPFEGQQAPIQPIPLTHGPRPSWLLKLRQWLPKFLAGACARLGEGEYYPLSSLKGDFRATCGLELDHLAVGYPKLSDFVRSLHDICRMKIVPVGRGPATHMVLLPLGRTSGSSTCQSPPLQVDGSFLGESQTYADAVIGSHGLPHFISQPPVESNSVNNHRVVSPQPTVEYVSELLAMANRPGSESQLAVLEAYRAYKEKIQHNSMENHIETSPPPRWHREIGQGLSDLSTVLTIVDGSLNRVTMPGSAAAVTSQFDCSFQQGWILNNRVPGSGISGTPQGFSKNDAPARQHPNGVVEAHHSRSVIPYSGSNYQLHHNSTRTTITTSETGNFQAPLQFPNYELSNARLNNFQRENYWSNQSGFSTTREGQSRCFEKLSYGSPGGFSDESLQQVSNWTTFHRPPGSTISTHSDIHSAVPSAQSSHNVSEISPLESVASGDDGGLSKRSNSDLG